PVVFEAAHETQTPAQFEILCVDRAESPPHMRRSDRISYFSANTSAPLLHITSAGSHDAVTTMGHRGAGGERQRTTRRCHGAPISKYRRSAPVPSCHSLCAMR